MSQRDRIDDMLDKLESRLDNIDRTLLRNTLSLEDHIKRTNILEETLKPIKKHVYFVNNSAKLLSGIAGAALIAKQLGLF